ncbi:MAG: acyltransferase, partial [Sphingobacteriaceae bacterium]
MIVEKIIRKLKGNSDYKWESAYSFYDLLIIITERGCQALRGIWTRIFLKKAEGLLFVGRLVKIQHGNKITVGKNFIVSDYCTINALSVDGITIGDNVSVGQGSTLVCTGVIAHVGKGIKIGNGTGINAAAYLAGQGGIEIGENVIIGPGVKIFSENHVFSDSLKNIKDQGVTRIGVKIWDNCWIGSNVTILDGVEIGSGCVIAAGAVVTKSI